MSPSRICYQSRIVYIRFPHFLEPRSSIFKNDSDTVQNCLVVEPREVGYQALELLKEELALGFRVLTSGLDLGNYLFDSPALCRTLQPGCAFVRP